MLVYYIVCGVYLFALHPIYFNNKRPNTQHSGSIKNPARQSRPIIMVVVIIIVWMRACACAYAYVLYSVCVLYNVLEFLEDDSEFSKCVIFSRRCNVNIHTHTHTRAPLSRTSQPQEPNQPSKIKIEERIRRNRWEKTQEEIK